MLRATYLFVFGVIVTLASLACCQETEIQKALNVSKLTGKPIFAIASRKVCGPCQLLKSRVAQHFQNTNVSDQVVYLRVDLDDDSWRQWSRKFPHQGRMLPIVYLIRSDERQMYGQSNTLPGDQLEKFLVQGVAHCGTSFSAQQIDELENANKAIDSALKAGNIDGAIKWIGVIEKYGEPGHLNSFASAAIKNNQLFERVAKESQSHVKSELEQISSDLAGNEESKFRGAYKFVELQDTFGSFKSLSDEFSGVAVKLAVNHDLRDYWSLSTKVYNANKTLVSAQNAKEKAAARNALSQIEESNAPEIAKLAAREVKRRHAAVLASLDTQLNSK